MFSYTGFFHEYSSIISNIPLKAKRNSIIYNKTVYLIIQASTLVFFGKYSDDDLTNHFA